MKKAGLADVSHGLSAGLLTEMWPIPFPVRAHAWVAGWVSRGGRARDNHSMFLSLSPSLPLRLKKELRKQENRTGQNESLRIKLLAPGCGRHVLAHFLDFNREGN